MKTHIHKRKSNKSGFTLIELIIVIIIIGVMASVAFPRIAAQIDRSRATEAINTIGMMMRAVSQCLVVTNNTTASCNDWAELGLQAPAGGQFRYGFADNDVADTVTITAYYPLVAPDMGTIPFTFDGVTGVATAGAGTGIFAGMRFQ